MSDSATSPRTLSRGAAAGCEGWRRLLPDALCDACRVIGERQRRWICSQRSDQQRSAMVVMDCGSIIKPCGGHGGAGDGDGL